MTQRKSPVETGRRAAVRGLFPKSVVSAIDRAGRSAGGATAPRRSKELFEKMEQAKVGTANASSRSQRRSR